MKNFDKEFGYLIMVVILMFGSLLAVWAIEHTTPTETALMESINQQIEETYDFCEEFINTYEDELEPEGVAIVRAMIEDHEAN